MVSNFSAFASITQPVGHRAGTRSERAAPDGGVDTADGSDEADEPDEPDEPDEGWSDAAAPSRIDDDGVQPESDRPAIAASAVAATRRPALRIECP